MTSNDRSTEGTERSRTQRTGTRTTARRRRAGEIPASRIAAREKAKKRARIQIAAVAIAVPLIIGYLAAAIYYEGHFFPGSKVEGLDAAGKTAEELEEDIRKDVAGYSLTIVEEDGADETISASDVGLEIDLSGGEVQTYLDSQNGMTWPVGIFTKTEYGGEKAISINESLLEAKVNALSCVNRESKPSKNASYEFSGDKFTIIDEIYGTKVKKKKLTQAASEAMIVLEDKVDLRKDGLYLEPAIKKNTKKLVKMVEKLNKMISVNITYDLGAEKETLDKAIQATFISGTDDYQTVFNDAAILEYAKSMGSRHNTFGLPRKLKTSYGPEVTVPAGGNYGWWVNYAEEVEQIKKDLEGGKDVERELVYHNQAASHDSPDYGDSYVEVDIATQHLFLVIKGEVVLESDFVSGNISRGNGTPLGAFRMTYKERDATLNGENYSTPVSYWMPFYYNVGLHDASWRQNFGGQIYKTSGSHGCINLPPDVAEKIYGYVGEGFPVLVYAMEEDGTEVEYSTE